MRPPGPSWLVPTSRAIVLAACLLAACNRDETPPRKRPSTPPASSSGPRQPPRPESHANPGPADPPAPTSAPPPRTDTRPGGPVGPGPAVDPDLPPFHPLADARAGEWALYRTLDGQTLRYEVRSAQDRVEIQVMVTDHGKPLGLPAIRREPRDFDPLADLAKGNTPQRSARAETFTAAWRTWEATRETSGWIDEEVGYRRETWVSPAAPVFGIVRMELYGDDRLEARLELLDCGTAP